MNPANQQSPCQSGGWRQPTGVSAQIWDRICSEESVREDERAAAAMDHADLNWVLDNLHANSRLVDLGCGSGRLLQRHQSRGGWGLGGGGLGEEEGLGGRRGDLGGGGGG